MSFRSPQKFGFIARQKTGKNYLFNTTTRDFALKIQTIIINENCQIELTQLIGRGGAGYVFKGLIKSKNFNPIKVRLLPRIEGNLKTIITDRREVIVKIFHGTSSSRVNHSCEIEAEMFWKLSRCKKKDLFPEFHYYGMIKSTKILVVEYCGVNFERIIHFDTPYNWTTIIDVVIQVYDQIKAIWDLGYVHKSVKPDNIVIKQPTTLFLVDYSRSCRYESGKKTVVDGNFLYANRNALLKGYGKKDDLYSLVLIILYLSNGSLPWNMNTMTKRVVSTSFLRHILTKKQILALKRIEMLKKMKNIDFSPVVEDLPPGIRKLICQIVSLKSDEEIEKVNFRKRIVDCYFKAKEEEMRKIELIGKEKEREKVIQNEILKTIRGIDEEYVQIERICKDVKENNKRIELLKKEIESITLKNKEFV